MRNDAKAAKHTPAAMDMQVVRFSNQQVPLWNHGLSWEKWTTLILN